MTVSTACSKANLEKIYCVHHALVTSVASGILVNSGHLLENLVFTALRRVSSSIYYYQTKSGREVDFALQLQNRSFLQVQVCESMAQPQTRKREVAALSQAMAEMSLKSGTTVTRSHEEQIKVAGGTIEVEPAWRFLLSLSEF
jgi:predicted AAA+ superfamily ATPase